MFNICDKGKSIDKQISFKRYSFILECLFFSISIEPIKMAK